MYGSKTTMIVDGPMNIVNNAALSSGGGFYLTGRSECWVMENTSLLLVHNHAGQFGGAVYLQDDFFYQCVIFCFKLYQANCFLQPTRSQLPYRSLKLISRGSWQWVVWRIVGSMQP